MDADGFDAMTRALTGAASSRRRLLTGVVSCVLGALATALGVPDAEATHFRCSHVGKRCTRSGQCCSSRCRGPQGRKTCRAHDAGTCTAERDNCLSTPLGCGGGACACYQTTGGANFCSSGQGPCMACTTDAQCATATGIPGSACVDVNHGMCNGCSGQDLTSHATACRLPCTT